jgi:hypothetical protein
MPRVRLPDGSIRDFPEGMSREEIAAVLRKEFPAPRPASLEPGSMHTRPNGAMVGFSPAIGRYIVHDAAGTPRGFRQTLDAAIDLADAILPPPPPRSKPEPQPVPKRVDVGAAAEGQIAADIDSHIRRREGQSRRAQRANIIQRPARRKRGTLR